MQLRTRRRGRHLVAAAATIGLLGLPLLTSTADAAPARPKAPAVKVMTRNLYLGADIMRPIRALAGADQSNPIATLDAFANANDETRDIVDVTDFETRVEMLADEIVSSKPDLVGLQEVALWRTGPMDDPLGSSFLLANAETVEYDFLSILVKELDDRGEGYRKLSVNTLSDVEGPAYEGSFFSRQNARDVRLTMHDVILVRKDSSATYVNGSERKKRYRVNMPPVTVNTPTGPKSIEFLRGYQWVDMKAGDRRFRFINTHLEAFSSDVAYAQAQELIDGPGAYNGRTIIVCDCNSDPANGTTKPDDTKRHWAPYFLIKREGGFHDTWLQWAPPEEGFTSGLSETVDDETAAGFDHRIDMVFARTAKRDKLPVLSGDVTGDEVADALQTQGGLLWPSDHAGVVMKLRLR
jgi:endonuclease/exonuclease/phosphatase family metal-dependent hydrolase